MRLRPFRHLSPQGLVIRLARAQERNRVYLAHLVEAQPQPSAAARRASPERELDQRWARNMMLNKWLEYCVERGHRFSSRTEQRAGA